VNPGTARYCHYDGVALGDGQDGPVAVGARLFLAPFVFPSGKQCRNFNELTLACEADWDAAREMLASGFFEAFFGGIGRADLALAARRSARDSDADRGLDALLVDLPGDRKPAKLVVSPREINLGLVRRSETRTFTLHVENQGMGLLSGNVQSEVPWLSLGDSPGAGGKLFQCRHEVILSVMLHGKALRARPRPQEARIVVSTGSDSCAVTVRVEVPMLPFDDGVLAGALSPREVAERARASPREAGRLFESGEVARWYEANGWTYPVEGQAASGMAAVQQFFEALGLTRPPQVVLGQNNIELAGAPGGSVETFVFVESVENRPIYAHAVSEAPWLVIGKARNQGNTVRVHLRVPTVPPFPGQQLQGQAIITCNGNQRFTVQVTLNVARLSALLPPPVAATKHVPISPAAVGLPPLPGTAANPPPLPVAAVGLPPLPVAVEVVGESEPPVLASEVRPGKKERAIKFEGLPIAELVEDEPKSRPVARPAGKFTRREREHCERSRQSGEIAWHLVPLGSVLLVFLLIVLHDLRLPRQPVGEDDERAGAALIDPTPVLELHFNDQVPETPRSQFIGKTMTFGLRVRDQAGQEGGKRLMFEPLGRTNNTCVRIDDCDYLFGHDDAIARAPGQPFARRAGVSRWIDMRTPLGNDATGRLRDGARSVWEVWGLPRRPCRVQVTQAVEIVPGEQSGRLDTCIIRYTLHNLDREAHQVGLRFLLDTYIGENDGVPFTIPGQPGLCSTKQRFDTPGELPDYIQALENESLLSPGTVAHVQFRVPGPLEAPGRVLLGGYPDAPLQDLGYRLANSWLTPWEVPSVSIRELVERREEIKRKLRKVVPDSAVTLYWNVKPLEAGQRREVGFTYGLGSFASAEGEGKLLLTVGGRTVRDGEFTLTALRSSPVHGEKLTLILPAGERFELLSPGEQEVPEVAEGSARPISTVTWRLRARRTGRSTLVVRSTAGVNQKQIVRITAPSQGVLD
jgi:hypothetical protein